MYERLIKLFRENRDDQSLLAGYLVDLGDPRALPHLHEALRMAEIPMETNEYAEAITRLGGELTAREQQKLQRMQAVPYIGAQSRASRST